MRVWFVWAVDHGSSTKEPTKPRRYEASQIQYTTSTIALVLVTYLIQVRTCVVNGIILLFDRILDVVRDQSILTDSFFLRIDVSVGGRCISTSSDRRVEEVSATKAEEHGLQVVELEAQLTGVASEPDFDSLNGVGCVSEVVVEVGKVGRKRAYLHLDAAIDIPGLLLQDVLIQWPDQHGDKVRKALDPRERPADLLDLVVRLA